MRREDIVEIAKLAFNANANYCKLLNQKTLKNWDEASDQIRESTINGVETLINNPEMTPEESHKNWMEWRGENGWIWGEVKDEEKKTHPNMVEYDELPDTEKIKDFIFHSIVRSLSNS